MFNSILWPVDGSPLSFAPLAAVIKLARLSRASVVVLSIAEPRLFRADDADSRETGKQVEALHLSAAKGDVHKARAAVEDAGIVCHDVVALSARPSVEIVDIARRRGCDLIVMATRGRTGVIDTWLGTSCTQEVINTSQVPVLVFP